MSERKIKVLIIDDMDSIIKRFKRILSCTGDIEVTGTASSGCDAIVMAISHKPDIILMDIEMETRNAGITASEQIVKMLPDIKIIILTVCEEDETIFSAFQTGIVDYIVKSSDSDEVVSAVRAAYQNKSLLRPGIAEKILREFRRIRNSENDMMFALNILSKLTESEIYLVELLIQGKNRREIAKIKCVEMSTVKSQINALLKKFNMHNTKGIIYMLKGINIFEIIKR